ncbi:MAG: hypothetical protein QOH88_1249 [Verrucomicrobiota bacterium]|jgi:hypothetical protein
MFVGFVVPRKTLTNVGHSILIPFVNRDIACTHRRTERAAMI